MGRGSTTRAGGALLGGVAVATAGLLAALALVYSNANGVAEVADHARVQQAAESALGAAAATRNTLGQVLILAAGGSPDTDLLAAWIDEVETVIAELENRVSTLLNLHPDGATVVPVVAAALDSSRRTLELVAAGDAEGAGLLATTETAQLFTELTTQLAAIRDAAAVAISGARMDAGDVATASRFMVALVIPTLALVAGVVMLRRRRRRERMAADLAHERTLNRSKDQLIANLSHELRTPLTGIYTSALAIDELGTHDPDTARELNAMIIDQSADLTRMVEDLLVTAQADAGRLTFAITPTEILDEIEAVVREFTQLGATIRVDAESATVLADPGRLRQVLRNLVSNAVRHGGPGIDVMGRPDAGGYRLVVADDGPGLPGEIEARLFERFVHDGDRPLIVGSVGLGLAITRLLVEGMGGAIAHRRRGGYTVFSVMLPVRGQSAGATPVPEEAPKPLRIGTPG